MNRIDNKSRFFFALCAAVIVLGVGGLLAAIVVFVVEHWAVISAVVGAQDWTSVIDGIKIGVIALASVGGLAYLIYRFAPERWYIPIEGRSGDHD